MDNTSDVIPQLPQAACGTRKLCGVQMLITLGIASFCALYLIAMPAFAQSTTQSVPENAKAKSYGDGWECNIGYRLRGDACTAVIVPENAYETNRTYGPGWNCHHGFRESDDATCVAVVVPEGGFLDPSGERWDCLRGFLKVGNTCQEVILPDNAYLSETSYRSAWECDRGFEVSGDLCVAIVVPANAYLNTSNYGQPWTCERGFFEQGDLCAAVLIPDHAYFDDSTYGKGWQCERGYAASDTRCDAINIPTNAHLDRSGNSWECNKNFKESKSLCVLDN